MSRAQNGDEGLGIIEIIIGVFLLAIIAVVILPALWQGVRFSSEQSSVATATRELNSLVEQARGSASCSSIIAATSDQYFTDGAGRSIKSSGTYSACPVASKTVTLNLKATSASNVTLATVTAIVYVP